MTLSCDIGPYTQASLTSRMVEASSMFLAFQRCTALSFGTHLKEFSQRTKQTLPLPFRFLPLFSDAFSGWDQDLDDDIEQLRDKFVETKWEITVGCFINCFFIVLRVFPIPVTAFHAYERQIIYNCSQGVLVDEDKSILLLYLFMILYIPAACLISLAEWKMMMVYLDKFHPWINILAVENDEDHAAPDDSK